MKFNECKECKSKNMLITSDLNGNVFGAVCLTCGWEFESPSFKKDMGKFKMLELDPQTIPFTWPKFFAVESILVPSSKVIL